MMSSRTISAAELLARLPSRPGVRLTAGDARRWLDEWERAGIVERASAVGPARYQLTPRGRAVAHGLRHLAPDRQERAA
jgi:hypothetical protein